MSLLQKVVCTVVTGVLLSSSSISFALSNKETVIISIDTLNTSITTSIADKEKTLSIRANELGNRYDTTIRSLGYQSSEIEALTSIKKLAVPSFRQDISKAFLDLKQKILQDIKATQIELTILRDKIALGYTDLSNAQKLSYDAKIIDIQNKYAAFLSGSTTSIDTFTETFSGRVFSDTTLVEKMMTENKPYILFIRDVRTGYAGVDEKKVELLSKKDIFEKQILPKVQGGFLTFTTNKKTFTNAIRKDLSSGLEEAMKQERIKKQEVEFRAYIEDIMSKWNEYLTKNFGQDDELINTTQDLENIITLENTLHNRIYDTTGNIQSLDISGPTLLLTDINKMNRDMIYITNILSSLIITYSTGNTLSSLNDQLITAYQTELTTYRADFTKLLEERLNTVLLEEKNHTQTLTLLDQEEQILKQNLSIATSADFTKQLVNNFITKINSLAKADRQADTLKKSQMLGHRYMRTLIQKKIDDTTLTPYYGLRSSLDTSLANIFTSLENKVGKNTLIIKFPAIAIKIDTLLQRTTISPKIRYSLLVVQSNIFKYLEDATK